MNFSSRILFLILFSLDFNHEKLGPSVHDAQINMSFIIFSFTQRLSFFMFLNFCKVKVKLK